MSCDTSFDDGLLDRRREIHVSNSIKTRARIKDSRFVSGKWQFNKRDVLAHGERFWRWGYLSHERPRLIPRERQSSFNFRVLGKVFCVCQVKSTASGI